MRANANAAGANNVDTETRPVNAVTCSGVDTQEMRTCRFEWVMKLEVTRNTVSH